MQTSDERSVLDLSSLPEDVPVQFDLGNSANAEILLTQDFGLGDDISYNIDIGIPRAFLESGGELDLDLDLGKFC